MGKKKSNAKRAAKKHQKEKKRQKKLVARRAPAEHAHVMLDAAWRPATEGIEGLAVRMSISVHAASQLADHLIAHHGRRDAAACWLPSRVRALSTDEIVARLAGLGVAVDAESYVQAAERHGGARRLAELEWPRAEGVFDRDFVGQAAVELWARWAPAMVSNEGLADRLDSAELHLEDEDYGRALEVLIEVWELAPALERLGPRVPEMFFEALADLDDRDPALLARVEPAVRAIAATLLPDDELFDAYRRALDDLDWVLGRGDALIDRMLSDTDPERTLDVAGLLLDHGNASRAQLGRVRDALESAAVTQALREEYLGYLDEEIGGIDGRS